MAFVKTYGVLLAILTAEVTHRTDTAELRIDVCSLLANADSFLVSR